MTKLTNNLRDFLNSKRKNKWYDGPIISELSKYHLFAWISKQLIDEGILEYKRTQRCSTKYRIINKEYNKIEKVEKWLNNYRKESWRKWYDAKLKCCQNCEFYNNRLKFTVNDENRDDILWCTKKIFKNTINIVRNSYHCKKYKKKN